MDRSPQNHRSRRRSRRSRRQRRPALTRWLRQAVAGTGSLFGQIGAASVARPVVTAHPVTAPVRHRRRLTLRTGPGMPVIAVAVVMALILGMLGFERVTDRHVLPSFLYAGLRPPPKRFPVLDASRPVGITINRIDLDAPVRQVGLAADGTIGVPDGGRAHEAGWYDQGPTPGQYGPAVIVGHVDNHTGPAVFHDLRELRPGDGIEVRRQDRSVAVFEVNHVRRFDKDRLPAQEVFGDFSRPNLRLITCGGRWVGGETGYADNVVVFADLVRARKS